MSFDFQQKGMLIDIIKTLQQRQRVYYQIDVVQNSSNICSYLYFSAGQYASQGGDSGGIIFNTKENKVVGIHMARAKKDNVVYSFYVPYSAIENKFGIRLY